MLYLLPAIHQAAYDGNVAAVKALLKQSDIDINIKNNYGNSPLHYAVKKSRVEVIKLLLLKKGVDINARNCLDETPLHLAARTAYCTSKESAIETIKLLLAHRAEIGVKDENYYLLYLFSRINSLEFRIRLILAGVLPFHYIEKLYVQIEHVKLYNCLQNLTKNFEKLLKRTLTLSEVLRILRALPTIAASSKGAVQKHTEERLRFYFLINKNKHGYQVPREITDQVIDILKNMGNLERLPAKYPLMEKIDMERLYFGLQHEHDPITHLYNKLFTDEFIRELVSTPIEENLYFTSALS